MLICISVFSYGKKIHNSPEISSLSSIQPYICTQQDAKTIFGNPDKIDMGREQTVWKYHTANCEFALYWNNRINRLEKYYFVNTHRENNNQAGGSVCQLKTGNMQVSDVIRMWGDPTDMIIGSDQQNLHYKFKNKIVNLYFRKGKLCEYQLFAMG